MERSPKGSPKRDETLPDRLKRLQRKAVAISYARGQDRGPRVVAKGHGELAAHILDLANAHGLPVRQDGDLVEVLEAVEVDEVIPLEAYALIAEILAYVYMANNGTPHADGPLGPPGALIAP